MKLTSRFFISCMVSLMLVLYSATVYLAVSTDHDLTLGSARRQVVALAGILEQHASRTMGEAEGILDITTEYLKEERRYDSPEQLRQFLRRAHEITRKSPQIRAVFLVDAQGMMVANSIGNFRAPFYVGDREYFGFHSRHKDGASHISAPVQSRISGSKLFTITRRVDNPDGSLQMVAGLAIDPYYFSQFYRHLDLGGTKGEVVLTRKDGTVLARFPEDASATPGGPDRELPQPLQGGTGPQAARSVSVYRESGQYPLATYISLDREELLAPWYLRTLRHVAGALASILVILILTFALVRRLKHLAGANETLQAQKLELELAAQVFEQSQQSIVITDPEGTILRVNGYFSELTGYSAEEAIGGTPRLLKSQRHDEAFYRDLWLGLARDGKWRGEIWNRKKNGDGFAAQLSISSVRDAAGDVIYLIGVLEDITEQKASSERIYHLAHFDVLTNLPNRRLFNDRLQLAIQHAQRYELSFAVLFLDLDNFKRINDTLGHHAGDLLLQAVAARLLESLRKVDAVARFGGDEFAVMLEEVKEPADVKRVAQKIIDAISTPLELEGVEVQVGVSIGVSLYPADAGSVDELFRNADSAMYRAKALGKNRCQFFDAEMTAEVTRRLGLESELRRGIPEELFLLYQPQLDLQSGGYTGAEALLRWRHPERSVLLPEEFLQMAEESGHMGRLWNWILESACQQAGRWQREQGLRLKVGVNIPQLQLNDPAFAQTVDQMLRESGLDPSLLELEIAEPAVFGRFEESLRSLHRLKDLGVGLALDSFGTGNASLANLKKLPLDRIKIDRSFIGDLEHSPENLGIVRMIIALARSLRMTVLAVGVEHEIQREMLKNEGCDAVQGFLLAHPMSVQALESLVRQGGSAARPGDI